jgi:D-methionine transport system ATP-binding protein
MIFQQFNLFDSRTVAGNVAYPLEVAGDRATRSAIASPSCSTSSASTARAALPGTALGRAEAARRHRPRSRDEPRILLADEATSALDPDTTQEVLACSARQPRLGVTIVLITHEMEVIRVSPTASS